MKRNRAVFTICQNEPVFLKLWLRYYLKHFPRTDIFILDHNSTDGSVWTAWREFRCNVVQVHREASFDHEWLRDTVQSFQRFLLQSYENVLFTEIDEFVVADPLSYPQGLKQYIETNARPVVRCLGLNIVQGSTEKEIDWSQPILRQRSHAWMSDLYSKPLLARVPLTWVKGFHQLAPERDPQDNPLDKNLFLVHLHRVDYAYCLQRNEEMTRRKWALTDIQEGFGYQNRITDPKRFQAWFYGEQLGELNLPIPDSIKDAI
jgi:hypothetical protein